VFAFLWLLRYISLLCFIVPLCHSYGNLICLCILLISARCVRHFSIICFPKSFLHKMFSRNLIFVGLLESSFLRVGIPVGVRLPTFGSP